MQRASTLFTLAALLLAWPTFSAAQILGQAEDDDWFGTAVAAGDFDGDGRDDLAVGAPLEDDGALTSAGSVNVIYGTATGLAIPDNQLWTQDSPGILGTMEGNDAFGGNLVSGDFDGDGRDDLAISAAFEDLGAVVNAGVVHVLYGTASGLDDAGNQLWQQGAGGIGNTAEEGDNFGQTLAAGDFNGDGFDDLLVGVPNEDLTSLFGTTVEAGLVHVLFGSASGLTATGSLLWSLSSAGFGDAEDGDRFGWALAAGDFSGNGFDDFAVGIIYYDAGGVDGAGGVVAFYGSAGGVNPGNTLWSQDTPDVEGVPEEDDNLGWSLASGDFDDDGRDDLAIGVPLEDDGAESNAGAVNVLYGTVGGLSAADDQIWTQNSSGVPDVSEANDRFGTRLSAGRFGADADDDLAIGAPGEGVDDESSAGAVVVIGGTPTGLAASAGNTRLWRQGRDGALDSAEFINAFGDELASGDFDNDGQDDLAVGVPREDLLGGEDVGAVNVISRALSATDTDGQFWYQGLSVTVAVTPLDPPAPVTVARGERIRFRVTIAISPGGPAGLDYWADAVFPNGNESGPYLGPGTVMVPPGQTGSATFRQRVGQDAPLGTYLYVVKIGDYPNEVLASAVFTITVVAAEGPEALARVAGDDTGWLATDDAGQPLSAGDPVVWMIEGQAATEPQTAASAQGQPDAPVLHGAAPNPFRGQATLRFTLSEAATARLVVYDALGREVARLVDETREAGDHAVVFDAGTLPSGTYLVRLEAGGHVLTERLTRVR